MRTKLTGYFLAITTITIWSSTFILTKLMLDYITPLQILSVRLFIATVFLFIIYPKFNRDTNFKTELLFLGSGVGLGLYFVFENTAVDMTYPSNVGLLVALSPLFTAIISSFREQKSYFIPKNIIGLTLALLGVGFVVFGKGGIKGIEPLGDFLAITAALMFSIYTAFLSTVKKKFHIIQKTRKVFIYTLAVLLIYNFIFGASLRWGTFNSTTVFGVLYLALLASSVAFIMWNKAIGLIGTFKTNLFIYLVPVFTMFMSYLVLDDPITLLNTLGTVIIILGLYITEKEPKRNNA
ncbi:MAG: DMT family transporter [Candidatus Izimaplasma sp.]|nr:DMT family transporter [Candidatus Izimaplasma bacterium]